MLLNRHLENEVKLKRINLLLSIHLIIGKDMEMCRLLTQIPSLVSNELTRPCTCETDPVPLNEVMNKGNNICYKHVISVEMCRVFPSVYEIRHISDSNCFSKTFHWILVFQTKDPGLKDIVTFYKIWHRVNNSANVNLYAITLRPTYMVGRG